MYDVSSLVKTTTKYRLNNYLFLLQVETSNFMVNSINVSTNANETLSILVSTDQSDVESSNIGASRSGIPGEGDFSPSASPGKSSVKSQSNSKPTTYRVKNVTTKGKKNRKEMSQNTDTAGSTSDIMEFKGVDKKSESTISSESTGSFSRKGSSNFSERDTEAEMSSPKMENCTETEDSKLKHCIATMGKKYSRDFLLSLSQKVSNIPSNFRITYDLRQTLLDPKAVIPIDVSRNMISGWEQITEKPSGVLHPGSHGSGFTDDGRWNKSTKSVSPGFEPRTEVSHRSDTFGFRSGQGGARGNLRSPRNQVSVLPHLVSPGGNKGNAHDSECWQHASGLQKALSHVQVMHKAEKKYEIRKVSDAEEAKYRLLKAILNKLTPQNFERLFEQVKQVKIDNAETLSGVIAQIFDKALMEPTFCEMYARFCYHLAGELPDFIENDQKITFKRLLLNKCQEEFERGEREQAEADRDEGEDDVKQSDEEREEKRICARRRMLGNIRLIGELYKKKMLTERIMHECIQKLLRQYQNPEEEDIESLCKLMSTIGEMIDHPKATEYMDAYFEMMTNMSNNMKLSSRLRFMLKDAIDLRENKWQQRRKVEGPQKIEELHRDAAQERQASRMTRGSSFTPSRRGHPADFGHRRPPMFSPPSPQMSPVRVVLPPVRGIGTQDVRLEEKAPVDNRIRPVPLSPRPMDTQVSLGPSGGLAKGLSVRGPPVLPGPPQMDQHSSFGEFRGTPSSMNGYNSMAEWRPHGMNQEETTRFQGNSTRPSIYGQPHRQGHVHPLNSELMNPGHPPGRSVTGHLQRPATSNILSGKAHSEEHLNKMSMSAIKEFYSARDEKELIMCVKDLDTPSFHPAMISLWVNDSFEGGNCDRDLLSMLLVNLTKSREGILNINQLSDGFRLVLANLEDAVTDAPKAAVYLGRMFGRIVIENVISLSTIGRLLQQGGEKPFQLIRNGLGYEVLENALEVIKLENGESSLEEICKSSNLRLEEFRPPAPK
ncbi:translation initiation factor [Lithospermum erythrorhizon]|uniref:Eukaryotic translation initiation factor 4G n=1 Tax=Lithospermum erythrorhizon TaxID=34254 RepID=A0AAV3P5M8_LITER